MKIGIITEFKKNTVNYGNNLQAYALNRYLRDAFPDYVVETLYFKNSEEFVVTSVFALLRRTIGKIWWKIKGKKSSVSDLDVALVGTRLSAFHLFQKTNIILSQQEMTWERLLESDYDIFIVGSDVVWTQSKAFFNRIKFLDFENSKKAVKISYAASFGQNMIPRENRKAIRRALQTFKAVSVRESSAVALLHSIGVEKVVQAADPTLLLPVQMWTAMERIPKKVAPEKKFIFAYLLGANKKQKQIVEQISQNRGFPIVYIPYSSGMEQPEEVPFGDIPVTDCSPEEWLWLVHHAEYIVTDSFHGVVFSTIFEKKFLVLKRNYVRDINVRLMDYVAMLGQNDKVIDLDTIVDWDILHWDYRMIRSKLEEFQLSSKAFLTTACQIKK